MRNCNILIMKKIICMFVALFGITLWESDSNAYIDRQTAIIRIMNKAAGKVQTLSVPVEQSVQYEKLGIRVRSCKQSDPFDAENFFAFLEIDKVDSGKIFSGWMNANEPGDNPLQNPDYDVWLVNCE